MSNVKLYNRNTDAFEDVPEEQVDSLVASGTHTFAGDKIPVVSPDGELGTIPRRNTTEAFSKGFRYASPTIAQGILAGKLEQDKKQLAEEEIGSTGAFAAGALSGATLGLSDVAMRAGGLGEARQVAREQFPVADTLGEVAGGIGFGVSSAGKAVTKATETVGKFASKNVANELAKKTVEKGLGSAVEGAFYGTGAGVTEAALGDPEDVAENIIRGGVIGSLFGGVIGAASPTAGIVAGKAGQGINKGAKAGLEVAVETLLGAGKSAEYKEALKTAISNKETLDAVTDPLFRKEFKQASKKAKMSVQEAEREVKGFTGQVKKLLSSGVQEETELIKAVDQLAPEAREAAVHSIESQMKQTYEGMKQSLLESPHISSNRFEEAVSELRTFVKERMRRQADLYAPVESKVETAIAATKEALKKEGIQPGANAGHDALAVWELRKNLDMNIKWGRDKAGHTDQSLREARTLVDDFVKGDKADLASGSADLFRGNDDQYTRLIRAKQALLTKKDENLNKALERLGKENPAYAFVEDTKIKKALKEEQIMAKDVLKATSREIFGGVDTPTVETLLNAVEDMGEVMGDRAPKYMADMIEAARKKGLEHEKILPILQNETMSSLDKALAISKELGLPVDEAINNMAKRQKMFEVAEILNTKQPDSPLGLASVAGYVVGGPTLGATMAAASAARNNPLQTLRSLKMIESATHAINAKAVKAAKGTASALLKAGPRQSVRTVSDQEKMQRQSPEFQKAVYTQLKTPQSRQAAIERMIAPLADAPQVQQATAIKLGQVMEMLANNMPKDPEASTLTPRSARPGRNISRAEMAKFRRILAVIEDNDQFLDDMANGLVPTPEQMVMLRLAFPQTHAKIVEEVQLALAESTKPLPPAAKAAAMAILEQPTAESRYEPAKVKQYQQILYAEKKPEVKESNSAKLKLAEDSQTDTQRIALT